MRTIKFRCFYRGVMYPVKEMSFSPDNSFSVSVIEMDLEGLGIRNVSPDSEHIEGIMQSTGLHDKNGKEIFDGDRVKRRVTDFIAEAKYVDFTCEVVWNGWCFGLCVGGKQLWGLDPITARECEVIGNIYQPTQP